MAENNSASRGEMFGRFSSSSEISKIIVAGSSQTSLLISVTSRFSLLMRFKSNRCNKTLTPLLLLKAIYSFSKLSIKYRG